MKPTITAVPGRQTRKVRAYGDDIRRLRADGCTFEAIREALAEIGLRVSKSTVQREAARATDSVTSAARAAPVEASPFRAPSKISRPSAGNVVDFSDEASGKDLADAFFERHEFNPLLREDPS